MPAYGIRRPLASALRSNRGPLLYQAIMAMSPLGYWPLDELSGTTAVDRSGNARDGTYSGTYTLGNWAGGDGRYYADFGGGRVSVADDNAWSANTASGLTIMALIRPESSELAGTTRKFIVSKGNASNFEWALHMSSGSAGRLESEIWTASGQVLQSEQFSGALVANQWNLVGFATASPVAAARNDLYGNSFAPLASSQGATAGTTYSNGTAAVQIGQRADSPAGGDWNGGIAHVAIFAGRRTASEIARIRRAAIRSGWVTA